MTQQYYGCPMAGFSIPAAEHRYSIALTLTHKQAYVNHWLGGGKHHNKKRQPFATLKSYLDIPREKGY